MQVDTLPIKEVQSSVMERKNELVDIYAGLLSLARSSGNLELVATISEDLRKSARDNFLTQEVVDFLLETKTG